eukprot:220293_1
MSNNKEDENTNRVNRSYEKIQRVIAAENYDDYLVEYFEQYQTLLSDYHHVISNQFELIQKTIRTCDKQNYHLNQNEPHVKFKDLTAKFYDDIIDIIHYYFQYSHVIGYRINHSMLNDMNNEIMCIDANMQKMKEYITKNTTKHINSSRHERFIESLPDVHSTVTFYDEKHHVINHFEIRNRNKCPTLENNAFKISLHKAEQYMTSDMVKAMKNTNNSNDIEENELISLNHILSIILYCDHQKLHNSLCRANKIQNNEKNHKINEYLMEAVEFFSTTLSVDITVFYHCFSTTCSSDELN